MNSVTIDRKELERALSKFIILDRATNNSAPIMGEVLDGKLRLWYESFEFSLWYSLDVYGEESINFSVPIEKLFKLV